MTDREINLRNAARIEWRNALQSREPAKRIEFANLAEHYALKAADAARSAGA